nr:hypothetical protein [Thiomonas sp.]
MSFLRDHHKLDIQIAQRALGFPEKINQKLLDRDEGIWASWIVPGSVPVVGLDRSLNKPSSYMGHGMRVVEPNQSLTIWRMQGQGVRQTMRHTR